MSFQKINKEDIQGPQGRECILVYGFDGKEFIKLKTYCNMVGVKDIIQVQNNMLEEKVQNIIDKSITEIKCEEVPKERAIVINGFSGQKLHVFLENFKRTGLTRPLIATTTETSLTWTFRELVSELNRERLAIARSKQVNHEDKSR